MGSYKVKTSRWVPGASEVVFRSRRLVRAGEEVLIDYGEGWWQGRGWLPLGSSSMAAMRKRFQRDQAPERVYHVNSLPALQTDYSDLPLRSHERRETTNFVVT